MKILWLGMVASNEMFSKMPARTIGQASAHAAQNSILHGIDNNNISVDTISAHNFPSYPVYPDKFVQEERWNRTSSSNDLCVGFWNIKYFSHFSKTLALKKAISQWLKNNSKEKEIHVVVYSLHSPLLYAANYAKKIDNRVRTHVIVPDLPSFVDIGASKIKKYLKKIDWVFMNSLMKNVDKYILFTKQMADFMRLNKDRYTVIEGSVNDSEVILKNDENTNNEKNKFVIMYAGVIDKYRGIIELIEAFCSIKNDKYELWLAGSGSEDVYVRKMMGTDNRIKQLGYISDRKKIIDLEQKATVLIHTALPNDEVTKYCFPSKLFEYMASGKPVISVKTEGIPEEYFKYIIGINDLSKSELVNAFNHVANMSDLERSNLGNKAREFVLNEKNQDSQAKKLIDFIRATK